MLHLGLAEDTGGEGPLLGDGDSVCREVFDTAENEAGLGRIGSTVGEEVTLAELCSHIQNDLGEIGVGESGGVRG